MEGKSWAAARRMSKKDEEDEGTIEEVVGGEREGDTTAISFFMLCVWGFLCGLLTIEGVDLVDLQVSPIEQLAVLPKALLEAALKEGHHRRPGAHDDGSASIGELLGDCPAVSRGIGDASNKGNLLIYKARQSISVIDFSASSALLCLCIRELAAGVSTISCRGCGNCDAECILQHMMHGCPPPESLGNPPHTQG
jgi:hypothetical protein